ncbi:MAG: hypothetical protein Q9195_003269 [Heterodermia aff. obscurata]
MAAWAYNLLPIPSVSVASFQQRNLNTITAIYQRNVYPTNLEFIVNGSSSVPKGLFNTNVSGRITPIGNFTGFQDSVEYFFALAPVPQPPLCYGFSKIQIVEFSSQCPGVAASVVYITESVINPGAANDGQKVATLKQVYVTIGDSMPYAEPDHDFQIAFWEFDDAGAVIKYDAWIPNLQLFYQIANAPATNQAIIKYVCSTVQAECTGKNTQYTSIQNCVDVLSAKPFGNWDEVWMDSVVCRELHLSLARVDPEVNALLKRRLISMLMVG